MQWPLDQVPADCTFQAWVRLEGNTVRLDCRAVLNRGDHTQYPARLQEMPAIYLNAPFHKLVSYTGGKPFTNDALTELKRPAEKPEKWAEWIGTERWAALVNDDGWGVGLWNPSCLAFTGGFDGRAGPNDTRAPATGYLAGQALMMMDHDMRHDYRCELIVGSVDEIRRHVVTHTGAPELPRWDFSEGRQGWRILNARDSGWRAQGQYRLWMERDDPQMISPLFFLDSHDASKLIIDAAFKTPHAKAMVMWRRLENGRPAPGGPVEFPIKGDGQRREYVVPLGDSPDWKGAVIELRFDPAPAGGPGDWVEPGSIRLGK
jgi:hypothetical protein